MTFPWIKRADIVAVRHDAGGWVLKDPLTLNYSLLDECEYCILNLLDGSSDFDQLLQRARQAVPWMQLTAEDLAEFIRSLAASELIRLQTGQGWEGRAGKDSRSLAAIGLRNLFGVLRVQIPLFNPSRLLDRMMPLVKWFVRPLTALFLLTLAVAAVLIVVSQTDAVLDALPSLSEFLGPGNVALMLTVFVVVKLLHEAGHALTARYFGVECNECGVMLLVMTPVLYTNVTDAWMLPRRQRMLITAAGILVELAVAAACTVLWWMAEPGITKSVLLNTMILCSVNTVLFNGNPLLRYDGYFLLADWMNIPNLASQSRHALQNLLVRLVTGRHAGETGEHPRHSRFLLTYGICSSAYRVLITVAILKLIDVVSREWHLQFIGAVLFAVVVTGFLVLPAVSFLYALLQQHRAVSLSVRQRLRAAGIVGLLAAVLLIPLPASVVAPAFVQPDCEAVYAPFSGYLQPAACYGQTLAEGTVIARLQNPELTRTRQQLAAQVLRLKAELQILAARPETADSDLVPSLQQSLQTAERRLEDFDRERQAMTVRMPRAGVLLPPESRPPQVRDDLPGYWSGLPLDVLNTGAWIERGTLLGYAGEPRQTVLLLAVDERDVESLEAGRPLTFLTSSGRTLKGTLKAVATLQAKQVPLQFSVSGMVNGRTTETGLKPTEVTFLCLGLPDVEVEQAPALYTTGRVRIQIRPASLATRLVRYVRQTF